MFVVMAAVVFSTLLVLFSGEGFYVNAREDHISTFDAMKLCAEQGDCALAHHIISKTPPIEHLHSNQFEYFLYPLALVILLIALGFTYQMADSISKRIQYLSETFQRIAKGKNVFAERLPITQFDEIASMTQAANQVIDR